MSTKRPKGKLTNLKLTALAGVDKPCQEPALAVIMKRKAAPVAKTMVVVAKQAVMTDTVDGHVHVLDLDDPSDSWCDTYSTSFGTSEGADSGHWHSWTFDKVTGVVTIGADSGHTHTLPAVVPPDVLATYAAREALRTRERAAATAAMNAAPVEVIDDPSDGIPAPVSDEESSGKVRVTVIEARAHDSKSTHSGRVPESGHITTEKSQMDKDKQIADLTAKNVELEKRSGALSRMSAVAFAVFKSLAGHDAEAFLAKTAAEQDAQATDIAKRHEEADKVVYVSKSTGDVYKAKDDARLIEMAKRMDAQAESIEKADLVSFAKANMNNIPGDDETHSYIVKSIRKGGGSAELIAKAEAAIKGANAESKIGKVAPGVSGGTAETGSADDALAKLEKGLVAFCKAQAIPVEKAWNVGLPAFTQTDEGKALKHAYDEAFAAA